ncbi:O-antigen ligase domain-containing protein [Anaerococcus nagyae]|uniref:O-antigen ligase domain-containing protein n=1 Tax=Anaerococcus nagyae TaxID=1755241 RepID=A0A3E2TKN0_9FIRM|nr:O-antigen ligase domain-containing protein [Anaerococcus nagyae]
MNKFKSYNNKPIKNIKLKYLVDKILVLIMLIYVFIPPYLNYLLEDYNYIKNILSIMFLLSITFFLLKNKIRLDKYLKIIIFSYICLILSTILNNGLVYQSIMNSLLIILLCLFLGGLKDDIKLSKIVIYSIRDMVFIVFLINTIVSIFIPTGIPEMSSKLSPGFLYGNINSNFKYILPGLLCSILIDKSNNIKVSLITMFFYFGSFYTFFKLYHTMTAFVGLIIIILWQLLQKYIKGNSSYIISIIIIFVLIFNILIVINPDFRISKLFIRVFGKDETLSNRTILWSNTINLIKSKRILGYGLKDRLFLGSYIGNYSGSHNYYLDIAYQRGTLGFIFNFIPIILINKNLYGKTIINDFEYLTLGFLCVYLIMFTFEPFYNTERFFIPLFYLLCRETHK